MVHMLNSLVAVACVAVVALVQAAPAIIPGLSLGGGAGELLERNVEMAVGRDALDVLEEKADLEKREVINCKITHPTKTTKWTAGEDVEVRWDNACVKNPKYANYTGTLLLGHFESGSPGEHLRVNHPLADDFLLREGKTKFTLPTNITTRPKYFVVLMGDSGNKSPDFEIKSA